MKLINAAARELPICKLQLKQINVDLSRIPITIVSKYFPVDKITVEKLSKQDYISPVFSSVSYKYLLTYLLYVLLEKNITNLTIFTRKKTILTFWKSKTVPESQIVLSGEKIEFWGKSGNICERKLVLVVCSVIAALK